MRFLFTLLLMQLFCVVTFAAGFLASVDLEIGKITKDQGDVQLQLKLAEEQVNRLSKELDSAMDEYNKTGNTKTIFELFWNRNEAPTNDDVIRHAKRAESADKANQVRDSLEKQKNKLEELRKRAGELSGQLNTQTSTKKNAQNARFQLRKRLKSVNSLMWDLSEDTFKAFSIDDALDDIESQYDKAVIGAYIQDKMGQLLNSNAICMARKRCATNDPQKIDPEVIQKELFPTSTKVRSDYYDKVKKRRSGSN